MYYSPLLVEVLLPILVVLGSYKGGVGVTGCVSTVVEYTDALSPIGIGIVQQLLVLVSVGAVG